MKLFEAYHLLIFLLLATTSTSAAIYAKAGCTEFCGSLRIGYPFGIGANCSVNEWYNVDCDSGWPYLSALNNLKILSIDMDSQTITVDPPSIVDCLGNRIPVLGVDLGMTPFLYSRLHNKFVVQGCGKAAISDLGGVVSGCSTTCRNYSTYNEEYYGCLGINCCQTTIPHYLKSYSIDLTDLESHGGVEGCMSAYLVDENFYRGTFQGNMRYVSSIPISLLWTLSDSDLHKLSCCSSWRKLEVDLGDGASVESWKCNPSLRSDQGTPYLLDSCISKEDCASCRGNGSVCNYAEIYTDDGFLSRWSFTCSSKQNISSSHERVILGVSISMGIIFVLEVISFSYKVFQKTKVRRQRRRFFKRNGGLLLKQQEEADPSLVDKTILFTSQEMEKATDCFNENRILGRGGQGTVYKGMLVDGRIVAVKKSKLVDERQLAQFINEVVILSKVNHRNVVKLLGCCLETEVPLLVSEFISNGTLYDRIHHGSDEYPISLNMRLQIATDVASTIAYLHSATSIPIYHRDIKTTNILLDDKYRAKISDFGTSMIVSMDQTHLSTLVKGTPGYLDPEYYQSSQFTEKSDVYSFGVVLIELLTSEVPTSRTRFGENRNLAMHFKLAMEEGRVMSIFDATVIKEGTRDEILGLANLAMRCLNIKGKNRPAMKEVAIELETIRASHAPAPFMVQNNVGQRMYGHELSMITYDEPSSTFLSFDENSISQ